MQKRFGGIREFNPGGRFQSVSSDPQSQSTDPAAGGGLPTAPPDASAGRTGGTANSPAQPNNNPSAGTPPSASASGFVNLSRLFENLKPLNIANAPSRPNMTTLAEALRKHFGDQADIDVDGLTIRVKTQKGVQELEVFTQRFGSDTRALLRLRVDKHTTRPIGNLVRYGDEYYIDADLLGNIDGTSQPQKQTQKNDDSQKPTDNKKTKRKLPKSVLYGAGLLASGGAVAGLSRFLGGGDDDDDKIKAQFEGGGGTTETIVLGGGPAPASGGPAPASGGPAPASGGSPSVTVTEQTQTDPKIVVNVPAPQVIREITSGEAPVQTRRKENETVVKAGTSDGVFTLNIGADKTLILKDKEVVGDFPTSEIIRAVGQMADGKTEKEIKRSGEFDDLLKNPWFLVAIALALVAFTRRGGRE